MTKKINPNLFRNNIIYNWYCKYNLKNIKEIKSYSYKNLQIFIFINLFFYKLHFKILFKRIFLNKYIINLILIYKIGKRKIKNKIKFLLEQKKTKKFYLKLQKINKKIKFIFLKNYLKNSYFFVYKNFLIKKLKKLTFYRLCLKFQLKNFLVLNYIFLLKSKNRYLKQNFLLLKFSNTLIYYFNNKTIINLIFKQLCQMNNIKNVLTKKRKKYLIKKLFFKVKKFENLKNNQFQIYINLISDIFYFKLDLMPLLSKIINIILLQFIKTKFLNIALEFLKTLIKFFLLKCHIIKRLSIFLKGSLKKKPRSIVKKIIQKRKPSNLKINARIYYYKTICFTKKGTIGIKINIKK